MDDTKERVYKCYKKVFDEENGNLIVPMNRSGIISEMVGFELFGEFIEEMYQRWLSEGNADKGVLY